jgi:hypothetical protein
VQPEMVGLPAGCRSGSVLWPVVHGVSYFGVPPGAADLLYGQHFSHCASLLIWPSVVPRA